uniref:Uncharacterized protein n=1 Tax=termite gut metagenome TaxID=433724 RepID=S0DEJ5_9ZZZZ
MLGLPDALKLLTQKTTKEITDLRKLNDPELKDFDGVLNIIPGGKLDKEFVENAGDKFSGLSNLKQQAIVAINLRDGVDGESNLLRFLGYLTFEYSQSFVIYNLDFELYYRMLEDNDTFFKTRKGESFWHDTKGMLIYTKLENRDFYFADLLYGKDRYDFNLVNKTLSSTFPNTASIIYPQMDTVSLKVKKSIELPFFHKNMLLPFDIQLKGIVGNPIFLSNIKTVLQNPLNVDSIDAPSEKRSPLQALECFVDQSEGYHLGETHFRIGNKYHSDDFYYAKRLFQNSFYTSRLAMHLAGKIHEGSSNSQPVTLVGYEMYSELLLSLIEHFLKEI